MNRRGQFLGQLVTTIPAIFIVALLVIIFLSAVVVINLLNTNSKFGPSTSPQLAVQDSRVLLEIFLKEPLDGQTIQDKLESLPKLSDEESKKLSIDIERMFAEKYSCGQNIFGFSSFLSSSRFDRRSGESVDVVSFKNYIDYPENSVGNIKQSSQSHSLTKFYYSLQDERETLVGGDIFILSINGGYAFASGRWPC